MNATPPTPDLPSNEPAQAGWRRAWQQLREPASWRMAVLGFAAGLPLLLALGTLSFRLREAGINRSTIGFLSWVGLAYGFKWAWSPLVDRLALPGLTRRLGRRRAWLLLSQALLLLGLVGMAWFDPREALMPLVLCAVLVAFASATQDIALDAWRIESAPVEAQATLAAMYQGGYRLAMIWAGAGVLWIAAAVQGDAQGGYSHAAWQAAYAVMALSLLPGVLTVLRSSEPAPQPLPPARNLAAWLREAVLAPLLDFWRRYRWHAARFLALVAVYRISDVVMGIMANPFYVDMGFTKDEVATVSKLYGVLMTLVGAFVGAMLSARFGVMRVLMLGALLSALTNLLFAWLAGVGHSMTALIWVVSADNLASGIASAAFIAYLSSLTNVQYSATQYALLSSLMLLLPKFLAGFSGVAVNAWGYEWFFVGTALLGLPVLLLVALASRR